MGDQSTGFFGAIQNVLSKGLDAAVSIKQAQLANDSAKYAAIGPDGRTAATAGQPLAGQTVINSSTLLLVGGGLLAVVLVIVLLKK